MKWWNSLETQVTWNLDGALPAVPDLGRQRSPRQADWTNDPVRPWLAIAYDELLNGVDPDFPGPLIGPYDKFRVAMRKAADSLIFNGATPDAAVKQASDDLTKAIDAYNKGG